MAAQDYLKKAKIYEKPHESDREISLCESQLEELKVTPYWGVTG